MTQPKDFGKQGGMSGVNKQAPRKSGVPQDKQAPMNGSSFRGKQPSGTGSNDSKKAR